MLTFFQTIVVVTWAMVLMNSPGQVGLFALHPPLQTLAIFAFTFGTHTSKFPDPIYRDTYYPNPLHRQGIITLQPTNQPKTKVAGLLRHQVAIFFIGFPCILLGTFAVSYNKWLRNASHFTTWHGVGGFMESKQIHFDQ